MLVLFADVWRPAVVGTLLVAAATYRIQGALTKLIRKCSPSWKREDLIPNGIHGTERLVQFVLVTTLAVSEILDSRPLLLIGLSLATFQVVILEIVGQAVITWGWRKYLVSVGRRLYSCVMVCSLLWSVAALSYFSERFASVLLLGLIILIGCVFVGRRSAQGCIAGAFEKLNGSKPCSFVALPLFFVGYYVYLFLFWSYDPETSFTVLLTPWKWRSLTEAPDGIWGALRLLVLWLIVLSYVVIAAFVIVFMFSFKIGSDRGVDVFGVRGARSLRRKERGEFMAFSESSIPSRHVLFHDIAVEGCDTAV